MSSQGSNEAVFVLSSDKNISKDNDRFEPLEQGSAKEQFFQPRTNSSLPSCEQIEDNNVPQLIQYLSQMSIEEQQQLRKQMSIEAMSPQLKISSIKKSENNSSKQQDQTEERQAPLLEMKKVTQEDEIIQQEQLGIRTRRKAGKTNYNVDDSQSDDEDQRPCHCSKTHCLQLYCSCFHNRRSCNEECRCNDCYNDGNHEDEVLKAVEQIKVKEQRASHHDLDSFDTKQVWGCKCKKTKCIKGYCECFIRGKKCTSHCQCSDCANKRQPVKKQKQIKSETQVKKKIKKKI